MTFARALICGAVLAWMTGPAQAKPDNDAAPSGDLAQRQLDHAKELYKQGVDAVADKQYALAVEKFAEAYKYAPDKHAFNFNIAGAALAAGDCLTAQRHYQQFLDLVPEHPERRTARAKLEQIKARKCARAEEDAPDLGKREHEPPGEAADKRVLYPALDATRRTAALYGQVLVHHGKKTKPFNAIVRTKRGHVRKLERLIRKLGYDVPERGWDPADLPVAGTVVEACIQSVELEKTLQEALATALEQFPGGKSFRVLRAINRKSTRRHHPAFKRCMRGS